jgi:dolichyl-phosphate beta-glucosyltransferase
LKTLRTSYDISLIIPVYNGHCVLEKHLTPFLSWLSCKPYKTQIILVDDGSADSQLTKTYARQHDLQFLGLPANTGKGAALRYGFRLAEANIQLFTDADIPFQYENIDTFISLLTQGPRKLIIGDRTDPSSVYFEKTSFIRTAGSYLVSALVNRFFVKGIQDTQCGLKGMGKEVASLLFYHSRIDRFAIDVELVYLARQNDVPIIKIPVQLRSNDTSSVRAVKDGIKLLIDLYRIRKIHGKRKHSPPHRG